MLKKLTAFIKSDAFRELFIYGVVGVATTLVNILAFAILNGPVRTAAGIAQGSIGYINGANIAANVLSIAFAFFANKIFVFRSRSWERKLVWKEAAQFSLARVFAMILDIAIVNLCVAAMKMDEMLAKIIANVLVIIVNYITGKLWVFRKK